MNFADSSYADGTQHLIDKDTIIAQATPPGRGGVAILRLSGPKVRNIAAKLIPQPLLPRQAKYTSFLDEEGDILDRGIAIFFEAPDSFTGEDVLELHGHGGPVLVDLLLKRALQMGARLARPGEFSERAFLNGKMDLAQAEAIADLIDAASEAAARSALRSLKGEFSKAVLALDAEVIRLRVYLEAAIDFSDEEIDFLTNSSILEDINLLLTRLKQLRNEAQQGALLREGITIVLAGEPNVGKSSLLNQLSGEQTAIVTAVPGTTRDVLREHILMDNIPVRVIDTAGLRETHDIVEQEGIRRAYQEIKQADILLFIVDATITTQVDYSQLNITPSCPIILIRNKIDLIPEAPSVERFKQQIIISLSAQSGVGVDLLKTHIKTMLGFQEGSSTFLARRRHLEALAKAHAFIQSGREQLLSSKAPELTAEDLRLAHLALNEITGKFTADDLLGEIFASFCIGK